MKTEEKPVHITFCLTQQIILNELKSIKASLPKDVVVRENDFIVEFPTLIIMYRIYGPRPLVGMRVDGYTFHSSVKTVDAEWIMDLNRRIRDVQKLKSEDITLR